MSKPNSTRKPAAARASTSIVRAVPGQAAPIAATPDNVTALPITAPSATEVLRIAALGIESHSNTLDVAIDSDGNQATRSMTAAVAAFNAMEDTAITERQGWAFLQTLNLTRAAIASRNGVFNPSHYKNAAAFAALGHEAADPSR